MRNVLNNYSRLRSTPSSTLRLTVSPPNVRRPVVALERPWTCHQSRPPLTVSGEDIHLGPDVTAKLVGLLWDAVRPAFGSATNNKDPWEGFDDGVEFRVMQGSGHDHLIDMPKQLLGVPPEGARRKDIGFWCGNG